MGNKRLICPVCGAVFSSNAAFYSHIDECAEKNKENELAKNVESDFQLVKAKFNEFLTVLKNFNKAYLEFGYDVWINLDDELVLSTPDKATCGNCKTEPSSFEQFLEDFVNGTTSKKNTKPCTPDYKEILHHIADSFDKEEDVTDDDLINKIREQSKNFSSIDESQFMNGLAEAAVEELFERFK